MHECLELIRSRASVRFFKPDPIPRDVLEKILEAGTRAPTAGGAEQWLFIVVESEEKRKELHELIKKAHILYATRVKRDTYPKEKLEKFIKRMEEGMYFAPVYVAAYIDMRRRFCSDEYIELEKLMAHQSLAAAIENMIITAWSFGVGSVWLGVPLLMRKEFDRVLEPPEGTELAAVIAFGYPAQDVKPKRRKPLSEVVLWR